MTNQPRKTIVANAPSQALLHARRLCYRVVSLCLADPRTAQRILLADADTANLIRGATAFLRDEPRARNLELARGERTLEDFNSETLLARLPASLDNWNSQFERVFGLLAVGACPPYETEYVPAKFTFQRSNALADIAGFYRAFGLQPSSTSPDQPDHILLELDFMALLIGLELAAAHEPRGTGANQRIAICRDAQARFLGEHLAWWTPAFAALLTHEDSGGFYAAVGDFLAAFMAVERALLQVDRPNCDTEPEPIEPPDVCSGCTLADL